MTPEKKLILSILRQAIRDYIRLDPDSDTVSAEYHINESSDYKTAEDFIYNGVPLEYGILNLSFKSICLILDIDEKRIKKQIAKSIIEY